MRAKLAVWLVLFATVPLAAAESKVTVGSPQTGYVRNAQNEPAIAVDPVDPLVLAAGANDFIDNAPCVRSRCNPTPGVGGSGIYFSFDGGSTWTQPSYPGLTAAGGAPVPGPIGTVPN